MSDQGGPDRGAIPRGDRSAVEQLERVFASEALLGMEFDGRYRVLGVTLEPSQLPGERSQVDRRIQLLAHPVATFLASLRRIWGGTSELLVFSEDQLLDVVVALGETVVEPPIVNRQEPRPGPRGLTFSLERRLSAADGTGGTITISAATEDLRFDAFVRSEAIDLLGSTGQPRVFGTAGGDR